MYGEIKGVDKFRPAILAVLVFVLFFNALFTSQMIIRAVIMERGDAAAHGLCISPFNKTVFDNSSADDLTKHSHHYLQCCMLCSGVAAALLPLLTYFVARLFAPKRRTQFVLFFEWVHFALLKESGWSSSWSSRAPPLKS